MRKEKEAGERGEAAAGATYSLQNLKYFLFSSSQKKFASPLLS